MQKAEGSAGLARIGDIVLTLGVGKNMARAIRWAPYLEDQAYWPCTMRRASPEVPGRFSKSLWLTRAKKSSPTSG